MQEEAIEEALQGIREAALAIDEGGRIVRCNTFAENLLKWPAQDLTGRLLRSIMVPEARDRFEVAFDLWVTTGKTALKDSRYRGQALTRTGERVDVEIEVRRFRAPSGERIVVGMFHPVARGPHQEEVLAVEQRLLGDEFQLV